MDGARSGLQRLLNGAEYGCREPVVRTEPVLQHLVELIADMDRLTREQDGAAGHCAARRHQMLRMPAPVSGAPRGHRGPRPCTRIVEGGNQVQQLSGAERTPPIVTDERKERPEPFQLRGIEETTP